MKAELRETRFPDNAFTCEFCGGSEGNSYAIYMNFDFAHKVLRLLYMACKSCEAQIQVQLKENPTPEAWRSLYMNDPSKK